MIVNKFNSSFGTTSNTPSDQDKLVGLKLLKIITYESNITKLFSLETAFCKDKALALTLESTAQNIVH